MEGCANKECGQYSDGWYKHCMLLHSIETVEKKCEGHKPFTTQKDAVAESPAAMAGSMEYSIGIRWSNEDECFIANCKRLPYTSAHGDTPEEALSSYCEVMTTVIEILKEDKEKIF